MRFSTLFKCGLRFFADPAACGFCSFPPHIRFWPIPPFTLLLHFNFLSLSIWRRRLAHPLHHHKTGVSSRIFIGLKNAAPLYPSRCDGCWCRSWESLEGRKSRRKNSLRFADTL
jgi:hypothetical protein